MKKIEITGGYVELLEETTRKMTKEYTYALAENSVVTDGGEKLTMKAIDIASEGLVVAMIHRAVLVVDGKEEQITVDRDWLDSLASKDFDKIQKHVLSAFQRGRDEAKK